MFEKQNLCWRSQQLASNFIYHIFNKPIKKIVANLMMNAVATDSSCIVKKQCNQLILQCHI